MSDDASAAPSIRVACCATKGQEKRACSGWVPYTVPTDPDQLGRPWQFRCSICRRYNIVHGVGVAYASSPKPFHLDNLPETLK
jgi:hypothetical protein